MDITVIENVAVETSASLLFTNPGLFFSNLGTDIALWFEGVKKEFIINFIDKNRWKMMLTGLENTLLISLLACLIGVALGLILAAIRTGWDTNGKHMRKGLGRAVLGFADWICRVYITIIRGTPVVVQLLIMYFIILSSVDNGVLVATVSFGLNSAAYVAEIFRSGIMSIDKGQTEAGRSLGLNYFQTMLHIVVPQAIKNVLPTLANEFIVLLKETSVAGYVAVMDLTFAGNRIRGATYSAFMPLIVVALVYLVLVLFFTWLVGKLERRLRQSDNR